MVYGKCGILITVLFLANALLAKGQSHESARDKDADANWVSGVTGHQGFIIIHSEAIREVKNSYPTGLALNIKRESLSDKAWETCHCYPRSGLALSYFDFDNKAVLGYGYLLSGFIEPMFRLSENGFFSFKATAGLGYLTNPYHTRKNPKNQSYSVRINGYLQLSAALSYQVAPRWQIALAANYNHISNGGIEKPNKGINYPTASIGADYYFGEIDRTQRTKTTSQISGEYKHQWEVNPFLGTKELNNEDRTRHWNYGLQFFYNHQLTHLHVLRGGGEWVVNNAVKQQIQSGNERLSFLKYQRFNLLVGHAFLLGKFRFSTQLGAYVFRGYGQKDPVFQRYSLTYQLTDRLHTGIGFKAHRHVADFLDVRMSLRF